MLAEGADDGRILEYASSDDRIVVTCDRQFTVVEGTVTDDHAGVIYAEQWTLHTRPEDAAFGVERIVSTIGPDEMCGTEFYLRAWM